MGLRIALLYYEYSRIGKAYLLVDAARWPALAFKWVVPLNRLALNVSSPHASHSAGSVPLWRYLCQPACASALAL